ncbi:helix-turn-helix transcriptional regulator [Archangium lipolyticum]|uniref:helix-turn-helix transcriptional regulator n=1 Tax=Archangium lipolyticum TaxID=2970465 RepID=UPI002149E0B9|nr:YafY family protein [Archangium lipolyticum]
MSRPTTRVLTVLELLQTHGRMSGAELARRMEVDRRTVRRYIAMLEELGIPITAERGRDGAYMLVAGFKLPPMMFTEDEALALSVGLLAARGLGLAEAAPAVASAQAKLERVMPASLKRRVRAVDETVTLDLARSTAPGDNAALVALSAASQAQRRVRLLYRAAEHEETERDFDPYGLAWRAGRWYAVGICHLRNGLRSFRLDRVRSVQPLEVSFSRPEGFDALEHLTRAVATLPRAYAIEVLLETDLETARRGVFPAFGVLEQVEGGVLLRGQSDDLGWFARELARLPFAFEIQRPDALREELASCARRLLQQARGQRH